MALQRSKQSFQKPVVHILFIIVLSIAAYSNTFHAPFQFDDIPNIVENPLIQGNNFLHDSSGYCSQIKGIHGRNILCDYFKMRYIGFATFALNYMINGLNVTGYHVINLIIHILNALLVYTLIILSFKTPLLRNNLNNNYSVYIAFFSALLFATHPIQTQAVTYTVQRFTSLTTMFYLSALVLYIKWRLLDGMSIGAEIYLKLKGKLVYIASIFLIVLAMKTKEISFTLPIIIALYEYMFFNFGNKKKVLYLFPVFLTLLIIPLSLIDLKEPLQNLVGDINSKTTVETTLPRLDYLLTEIRVIVTYIRLIFLPINQNLDYDYPIHRLFFSMPVFLSFLFLISILGIGIYFLYCAKRDNKSVKQFDLLSSFGILWFFITLSVESSILPIADVIFEHRLYLPSIGVFITITTILFWTIDKTKIEGKMIHKVVIASLTLLIIVLIGTTYARNKVWQNSISLWEDVVKKSPHKGRGYLSLGSAYMELGKFEKAIVIFNKALSIDPNYAEAHYNLGLAFLSSGDLFNAKREWEKTLVINPSHSYALNQLGNISLIENNIAKAGVYYYRAVQTDYGNIEAHYNLAVVSEQLNRMDEAVIQYRIFLQIASPQYSYLVPNVQKKLYQLGEYPWQK
jgi:protein O-mannosyl-transferase